MYDWVVLWEWVEVAARWLRALARRRWSLLKIKARAVLRIAACGGSHGMQMVQKR